MDRLKHVPNVGQKITSYEMTSVIVFDVANMLFVHCWVHILLYLLMEHPPLTNLEWFPLNKSEIKLLDYLKKRLKGFKFFKTYALFFNEKYSFSKNNNNILLIDKGR